MIHEYPRPLCVNLLARQSHKPWLRRKCETYRLVLLSYHTVGSQCLRLDPLQAQMDALRQRLETKKRLLANTKSVDREHKPVPVAYGKTRAICPT